MPDEKLKKFALWTYYKGALRDPGLDEGATTIAYVPEKGWFWYIPLPRNIVSVGIVAEKDYLYRDTHDPSSIFLREIENNPWIKRHLAPGRPCEPFRVTSEFSYRSRYCSTDGLVLAGDAFGFLDPVFSSGLFLALMSGQNAGDAVDAALRKGNVTASQFTDYGKTFRQGIEAMRKLVYAFYDHEFNFRKFVDQYPNLKGDLTDCLIGNLLRDFKPLFKGIAEFTELPRALSYGKPLKKIR